MIPLKGLIVKWIRTAAEGLNVDNFDITKINSIEQDIIKEVKNLFSSRGLSTDSFEKMMKDLLQEYPDPEAMAEMDPMQIMKLYDNPRLKEKVTKLQIEVDSMLGDQKIQDLKAAIVAEATRVATDDKVREKMSQFVTEGMKNSSNPETWDDPEVVNNLSKVLKELLLLIANRLDASK